MKTIHAHIAKNEDIPFMVALSYEKRRTYEKVQPKFWKYAGTQAESSQANWFESLLKDDNYIILVAKSGEKIVGFVIGKLTASPEVYNPGGLTLLVDDFCVDDEVNWQFAGKLLIDEIKKHAKAKGAVQMVVVCGNHDISKADILVESDLAIVSNWYHCDLN